MKTHAIGIDFGTTKTLVSHINPLTNNVEPIRLGRGSDYIPTTVYVDSSGQFSYGDDADDMIEDISGCYLRGFKMGLGSAAPLHLYLAEGIPHALTAKELVKAYLQNIRNEVESTVYHGEPITSATITRPINFSPAQCAELKQAAIEAGFNKIEFTTEPEAAGVAFCQLNAAKAFKKSALIVDWGGGTLDFALVTRQGDIIKTHSKYTGGDISMGGEKFDERLWKYAEGMFQSMGINELEHTAQMPKIRRCKEQLSKKEEIKLLLSSSHGACPPLFIKRDEFNKLIVDDIEKASQKIKKLLADIPNDLKPEMLLLVGGSSQIPLIKERLESACHLPAYSWHYSREAVSLGAALWGTHASNTNNNYYLIVHNDGGNTDNVYKIITELFPEQSHIEIMKRLCKSQRIVIEGISALKAKEAAEALSLAGASVSFGNTKQRMEVPFITRQGNKQSIADKSTTGQKGTTHNSTVNVENKKSKNLYLEGFKLFGNGQYAEAFKLAKKGHQQGDISCTMVLADCFIYGANTPIDYLAYFRLAQELEAKQSPAAHYMYAIAYTYGYGCPINPAQAESHARKWASMSAAPMPELHEVCRLILRTSLEDTPIGELWKQQEKDSHGSSKSPIDFDRERKLLMENADTPNWYALIADENEVVPTSILEGIQKEEESATSSFMLHCKALASKIDGISEAQAKRKITESAKKLNMPEALMVAFRIEENEKKANALIDLVWKACQYGVSFKPADNSLPCNLSLQVPNFGWFLKAYHSDICKNLIASERIEELFVPHILPNLLITNNGSTPLSRLSLSIYIAGIEEKTFPIQEKINPGQTLTLDLNTYDMNWNTDFKLELRDQGGRMCKLSNLKNIVTEFMSDTPPDILAYWETGFWGGKILKLSCLSGTLTNVQIHGPNKEVTSTPFELKEGNEPTSIGWLEMSNSESLKEGIVYSLTCNETSPILIQLLTGENEDTSGGWKTASKIIGGVLIGSLLGS